jgi:hypothetical protein
LLFYDESAAVYVPEVEGRILAWMFVLEKEILIEIPFDIKKSISARLIFLILTFSYYFSLWSYGFLLVVLVYSLPAQAKFHQQS